MSEVQAESGSPSQHSPVPPAPLPPTLKVFQFENGRIHYQNHQQTVIKQHQSQMPQHVEQELAVHNYLCYQENDKLIKVTEILLQDKILRIRDQLRIVVQGNGREQEGREEKRRQGVFGRRNNYSDPGKDEKSDTKNLIKNIINLFSNWLRIKDSEQADQASKKVKRIIKKMKYYNKLLIQEMCKDRQICNCFIEFSETDSEIAIENSRIKDKECHSKAIKNYTRLFSESRIKMDKESTKSSQSNMES